MASPPDLSRLALVARRAAPTRFAWRAKVWSDFVPAALFAEGAEAEGEACPICHESYTRDTDATGWLGPPVRVCPARVAPGDSEDEPLRDGGHVYHYRCYLDMVRGALPEGPPFSGRCPECRVNMERPSGVQPDSMPPYWRALRVVQAHAQAMPHITTLELFPDRASMSVRINGVRDRILWNGGQVDYYAPVGDVQRITRTEYVDGSVGHYAFSSEHDTMRLSRIENPDGSVEHYRLDSYGSPLIIRKEVPGPDGYVEHYGQIDGRTVALRRVYTWGKVEYFTEVEGKTCLLRVELPDGIVKYYTCAEGKQRMSRRQDADGSVHYYELVNGKNRRVRSENADGGVVYYELVDGKRRRVPGP